MTVQRPIHVITPPPKSQPGTNYESSLELDCNFTKLEFYYEILLTSIQYPTGFIKELSAQHISSIDIVIGFRVEDRYIVVGPDFEVIVNSNPSISVVIIDESTITIETEAIAIVSI